MIDPAILTLTLAQLHTDVSVELADAGFPDVKLFIHCRIAHSTPPSIELCCYSPVVSATGRNIHEVTAEFIRRLVFHREQHPEVSAP